MRDLTFVQMTYAVIAVPAFLWAFASMFSAAGTRHGTRHLAARFVWAHDTAGTHLKRTTFGVLAVTTAAAAAWFAVVLG